MTTYQSSRSNLKITAQAWRLIANGRFWPFTLLVAGVASNGVYAHAPLAAFACMSGATLSRRRAIGVALLIWLVKKLHPIFILRKIENNNKGFFILPRFSWEM